MAQVVVNVGPGGQFVDPNQDYSLEDGRKLTKITIYSTEYVSGVSTDTDADGKNSRNYLIGKKNGEPQPSNNSSCINEKFGNEIEVGGWGGNGGTPWTFTIPNDCKLSKIRIASHGCVYSIQFTYLNPQGREIDSPVYGTDWGDSKIETLPLGNGDILTGVTGTFGKYENNLLTVITSLSFKVGNQECGPYGSPSGTAFSLPVVKGKITGFFGNSGHCLDNLGVVLAPIINY